MGSAAKADNDDLDGIRNSYRGDPQDFADLIDPVVEKSGINFDE